MKPAADITDWTALTPDYFFAALKTACRAESVPAAAVRQTERRLADGVLQACPDRRVGMNCSELYVMRSIVKDDDRRRDRSEAEIIYGRRASQHRIDVMHVGVQLST